MPIVCFEGPSAIGKTTLAQGLADTHRAIVIPEVNLLFSRPSDPSPTWYFERQVERWQHALAAAHSRELVILDGDPFQPFWYNWAYRTGADTNGLAGCATAIHTFTVAQRVSRTRRVASGT